MTCNIIRDLLPLYAAEDCSDDSRKAVEEHIKTCDSCRASLLAMQEPVAPPPAPEAVQQEKKVEAMNFRKGFKRIRRKWLISILCVLLAIPFGVLGVNEVRGQGYAYSNLYAAYQTDAFMRKIVAKDYEGAFEYIDVNYLYQSCIQWERLRDQVYDRLRKVQIGGETYYSRLPADTDRSIIALEGEDPAVFWAQMIVDNAEQADLRNPIPAEYMDAAMIIVNEKFGKEVSILTSGSEEIEDKYAYFADVASDGRAFYFPCTVSDVGYVRWNSADYLAENGFNEFMDGAFEGLKGIEYHSNTYEKLGFEEYKRLLKEDYIQGLETFDQQGIYATSYSIKALYRGFETFDDSQTPTPYWEIQVEMQSNHLDGGGGNSEIIFISHDSSVAAGYGNLLNSNQPMSKQQQLAFTISCYLFVLDESNHDHFI